MADAKAREKIKNAFLELVGENGFFETTITDICKKADIHRSTFYTYYSKKEDVLNELLYDSLAQIDSIFNQVNSNKKDDSKPPLCIFIRNSKKYHPIFRDPALSDYLIGKLVYYFSEFDIPLSGRGNETGSDTMTWFQLYGCFHTTVKYLDASDEVWEKKKREIDEFIGASIKKLDAR